MGSVRKRNVVDVCDNTYLSRTWCLSNKASAPVTSFASSSEETRPRIPLIQDIRSLGTHINWEFFPPSTEISHTRKSSPFFFNLLQQYSCGTMSHIHFTNNTPDRQTGAGSGTAALPEVAEETLQVMRISKLLFALVSTFPQTIPSLIQLGTFFLEIFSRFWMWLDQTLGSFTKRIHLEKGKTNTVKTKITFSVVQSLPLDKKKASGFVLLTVSPCLRALPSLSQSLHVCAAEPARWPSHVRSCPYLKLDSSPLSILSFHQHLWFEWEGKDNLKGSLTAAREGHLADSSIKSLPKNSGKIGQ